MYLQYKYFKYNLYSIQVQFEAYKFTFYMDSESIVFYLWHNSGQRVVQ
jgi:hypothetical protein